MDKEITLEDIEDTIKNLKKQQIARCNRFHKRILQGIPQQPQYLDPKLHKVHKRAENPIIHAKNRLNNPDT